MGSIGEQVRGMFDALHSGTLIPGYSASSQVTLRKVSAGDYDPSTGTRAEAPQDITEKAIVRRYEQEEIAGSGGLILRGDIEAVLRKSIFGEVDQNARLLYQGQWHEVVGIKPREIDGAIYDYVVQARA